MPSKKPSRTCHPSKSQAQSVEQLNALRGWLNQTLHQPLLRGLLGKALSYLDKNRNKLAIYVQDERLNIDNNPAENAIRPFVVGRKNCLFSVEGARPVQPVQSDRNRQGQWVGALCLSVPSVYQTAKEQSLEQIEALLPCRVVAQDRVG